MPLGGLLFSKGRWREYGSEGKERWGEKWERAGRGHCIWDVIYERRINKKEKYEKLSEPNV